MTITPTILSEDEFNRVKESFNGDTRDTVRVTVYNPPNPSSIMRIAVLETPFRGGRWKPYAMTTTMSGYEGEFLVARNPNDTKRIVVKFVGDKISAHIKEWKWSDEAHSKTWVED